MTEPHAPSEDSKPRSEPRAGGAGSHSPHPIGPIEAVGGLALWYYCPFIVQEGWTSLARLFVSDTDPLPGPDFSDPTIELLFRTGLWVALSIALLVYVLKLRRLPAATIGLTPVSVRRDFGVTLVYALIAGGVFAAILAIAVVIAYFAPDVFGGGTEVGPWRLVVERFGHRDFGFGTLLNLCLIMPIIEEVWFRGWLYSVLREWLPRWMAIGMCATVFAFAHSGASLSNLPVSQLVGGFVFTIAFDRTGNLAAPILLHMLGNSSLVAISWLTLA